MLINVQASIILYWILLAYLNAYAIMPSSVGSTFNPGQADCHEAKVGDALIQMGLTHLSCVCVGVVCVYRTCDVLSDAVCSVGRDHIIQM